MSVERLLRNYVHKCFSIYSPWFLQETCKWQIIYCTIPALLVRESSFQWEFLQILTASYTLHILHHKNNGLRDGSLIQICEKDNKDTHTQPSGKLKWCFSKLKKILKKSRSTRRIKKNSESTPKDQELKNKCNFIPVYFSKLWRSGYTHFANCFSGWKTLYLTLTEEHKYQVFKTRCLWK
jgi:hypothetical protein